MIYEYDLSGLGINQKLNINGCLQIISLTEKASTLFLFDEYHTSLKCKLENIENAKELIFKADVGLIAVEGSWGGYYFDIVKEEYTTDYTPGKILHVDPTMENPEFTLRLMALDVNIVGVDSEGMCDRVIYDIVEGKWDENNLGDHPLHLKRSHNFIKTLLKEKKDLKYRGNIILNAGRQHIDDIINLAQLGSLDNHPINLVRVRPTHHPDLLCE